MARNLNLLIRKAHERGVASSEKITVPAGAIDAWRVEAIGADGTKLTIWIDKKTYRHVKTSESPPPSGGAMTQEPLE